MSFDENQHNRLDPVHPGAFSEKHHSAPEGNLITITVERDAQAVARDHLSSAEELTRAFETPDHSWLIDIALAKNPNTPSEILSTLAESDDTNVREAVARHPATPPEALGRLAENRLRDVRALVGANPSTPELTLQFLATDPDVYVQFAVARRPKRSPELRYQLKQSRFVIVREANSMY